MSKAFKKFRTKLVKTSVVVTAGLITYSMAHGAEFGFGEILEIENNNKEDSSIIQDKVNGDQVIEGLETVFYKRNNELKIKWDKVDSAQAYRIYKIKDKNCKDVLDGKNLVLLDEVETNKIKINDVRVIGSPKINIVNRESKDIELAIEMENEETEYGIYIEAIDEEKNVIAKSDMSLVRLGDKLLGYSYKITYSEDAKVDSKVDAGVSEKINISLSNKSKYIHIKGIYESGASSDVTVYELPIKDKETSNSIVNIGSRLSGYSHKNTPSTWTNKSVDINVSATSSVGFKSIKKPNGEVIDFKTSDLHLVGGDKYDLYSNIKPTKDGGFIVSGKSASSEIEDKSIEPGKKFTINNKGGTDGLIVKYSKDNKIEMVSSWGTANDDAFYNVTEVIKNGIVDGYMAVGQTVTSEGRKRGLVVMFNKDGTVRWRDIIEEGPDRSTIEEAMWSVIQDSRGNLIVAGWVDASTNFDPDPYILKYNPDSSTPIKVVSEDRDRPDENHWEHETIDSIAETKDGGYVAVGRSMVYDHSIGRYTDARGLIIKYDKDFNVEWSDTFGGDYDTTRGFDFDNAIIASNGDIVVTGDGDALKSNNAGEIIHDSKGGRDGFLVRYDSKTGEIKWQTRFGGSQDEQIYSVYELANGDLISTGYTKSTDGDFSGTLSNGMDGHDAFIMTFDGSTGERKGGVTRIGGAGKDIGWWTGMLNDGRLVTVGETTSAGSVNTDAFLAFPMGATSVNVLYNVDENGEYVFEFTDILGKKREYVAEVTNIKKSPPVIKLTLAATPNNKENYINLNWDVKSVSEEYRYRVYARKEGKGEFDAVSTVDFDSTEKIKILQVYPSRGLLTGGDGNGYGEIPTETYTTWDGESVTLPKSARLKRWMQEPVPGYPKGYGKGLFSIDAIEMSEFLGNPSSKLKDSNGEWKYDILVYGICDENGANADLTQEAKVLTEEFLNAGRGVLFGHDTIRKDHVPVFKELSAYLKIDFHDKDVTLDEVGGTKVEIQRRGLLTEYPYFIGEKGEVLDIPFTHNVVQVANGEIWMDFENRESGPTNFYLTTWRNAAFIQTGHSNGEPTDDEQKILANTLFYLKQLTQKKQVEDRNGMDLDAPTKPVIKSELKRKFSLTKGFEKNISMELSSEDIGTTYEHYVEAMHKSNYDEKVQSNMTTTEVKTGVKGYSYVIDTKENTEPDNIVDTEDDRIDVPLAINEEKYIHIKAIDNAGNGSETLHYKISSPGGNTDYSVNNGRVTNLDGVSVSKVMKKGAYKYAFDIKNLTGTPFIETFGGSKNEHIYDTIVHDGDYVSVGHSVSNDYDFKGMNKGREDIFVVKHNNKGELIWKKTFGGSIDEYAMSVSLEEDGYIIVGYTISRDGDFSQVQNGNANGYIMKLDFDGNIIWNNTVYAHEWDMFNDFVKRDDGGYIVVGSTQSHPGFSSSDTNDIMVVGISEDGKTEYIKYIGGNYRDRGERIINNKDGTYTIIGQSFSTRGMASHKGGEDGVLVKIDNNGNVLKCKNFGGSGDDHFRQVYQMDNGDFVVVGYTESNDKNLAGVKTTTDRDGLVVLFDKNWNVKWVKTVGGTKNEWLLDVYVDDTGIMTAGFGGSNDGEFAGMNKGGEDAIVVRFSLDGEKEWIRSFGGSGEERLRTMVRTPEGGYLIGGDTTSIDGDLNGIVNRGSQDALLVKFNQDGTFGILSQDNEISEVKYKIETNKSGIRKLVTEGVYTNEVVNPGEKKTKTVDFTVPDIDAEEIVITTQLKDDQDTTSSNNKIETRVPINQGVGTDYALKNDKVIDQNRVEKDEVEIGLEYRYNFDVLNTDTAPFIKTFGGSGNEHFEKHIITSDGGILAVGRTNSNNGDLKGMNKGGTDALIVKYDHHGNVEWKDSYGSSGNEMFYHVAEFSDCYIAVGQYNGKENLIVKYNKDNGKVLKDKRYLDTGLSSSRAIIIQANSDDSFYVAASSYDPTDDSIGPSYSKFDKNLDPVWTQHLHQSGDSGATAIYGLDIGENSGDIYVTGKFGKATGAFAGLQAKGSMDAFVLRASATNGKVKWIKSFTGTDVDDGRQVAETLDGSIIVIGRTMSGDGDFAGMKKPLDNRSFASGSIASDSNYRRQDGWVARMNASNGKVEKIKTIGGGGYDNLRYLMRMKDGSFLISGDTASLDGDFSGRVVKDNGYSDTVWIKMDKNLNITWISILGGNNDDATQSGIELPDGSIVVAGETKSTTGDFAGLNNGGQDAFIARLNADGELEMYPHDEMISQIKYDFTWSDGNKEYPIKSGSIDDVKVPVGRTVNKEVAFEVPRDSRIKTITMSAEIHDSLDVNENNNRISKTVNVDIPRDYLFEGYNVKEKGKTALQGTLRKNTEYELNLKLANRYIGTEKTRGWFLQRNVASTQSLYMPKIDSLKYKIVSTDGIESQEVNRITLNNVKGTVLAQGEKKNIEVADQDSVWEKISFKTLDDESMSEVIFVAEISSLDDGNPNNNRFVVKLPILNKINPEIYIENVVVYPNGGDNGKLVIGNEVNVKVTLGANTLKTNEADVKLKITDGNETVELNKKAFSISKEYPGVVYFKYKPNSIGRLRVVAEVSSDYGTEVFNSVYAQVEKPKEIKHYEEQGTKSNDNYDIPAEVVTYLKVQKRDKDAVKVKKCVDESHCQQDFNGRLQCPGHEYYDWGDWYNAFIPVKATELRGYEEKYEIKKVLFRSKETEKLKGKGVEGVDNDGMVDLMDEEKSNLALVKAGYGFELRTETEYKNNLPKLLEKASVSNIAPSDTSWSQYKIIPHAGQGIPFIYYSEELNGTDELILSNKGAVSFTVPSLDDIIIENPDQLYIKMPDGEYIIVDEGYGESYGDEVATKLEVVDDSEKLVSGDAYYDRKVIEFKKSSGGLSGKRNYYISDNVSDGEHEISIFNRYSGYGPAANNKLHVKNKVKVTVKGGKYDDIIDMGQ